MLVRLKDVVDFPPNLVITKFQFHAGSIKSGAWSGSIGRFLRRFNSMLVRLKVYAQT